MQINIREKFECGYVNEDPNLQGDYWKNYPTKHVVGFTDGVTNHHIKKTFFHILVN